jgi:hypothetical protein
MVREGSVAEEADTPRPVQGPQRRSEGAQRLLGGARPAALEGIAMGEIKTIKAEYRAKTRELKKGEAA